jgi:putative hydrolase of the HAD superfamily
VFSNSHRCGGRRHRLLLLDRSIVLTSSEIGSAKPDARAVIAVCDAVGQPPNAVAYVGDNLEVDARAATAAGLRGIWLDRADSGEVIYWPTIASLTALAQALGSSP